MRASQRRVVVVAQGTELCDADVTLTETIEEFKIKAGDAYTGAVEVRAYLGKRVSANAPANMPRRRCLGVFIAALCVYVGGGVVRAHPAPAAQAYDAAVARGEEYAIRAQDTLEQAEALADFIKDAAEDLPEFDFSGVRRVDAPEIPMDSSICAHRTHESLAGLLRLRSQFQS